MRKETQDIATAFIMQRPLKRHRTRTDGESIWLHNNLIAKRRPDGRIFASLAGWNTPTTRERLNGLCRLLGTSAGFSTKKGQALFNGKPVDARAWVKIKE